MDENPQDGILDNVRSSALPILVLQPLRDDSGSISDFELVAMSEKAEKKFGVATHKAGNYAALFHDGPEDGLFHTLTEVAQTHNPAIVETARLLFAHKHVYRMEIAAAGGLLFLTLDKTSALRRVEIALDEAIEDSEKQRRLYESITNNTPDLVYVFSMDYKFTYANKALLGMWGKSAEDAIGKGLRENGYEEWHALMHEREIDEVAATKQNVRGTVSFPHAELGSRVYDYILVPVLNEAGEVEAVAGTTRDITELRQAGERLSQSEARLKMMIDQTPAPTLVLMSEELVIEQINKPMLQMIGHGEEVIGKPLIEVLPELSGSYIWEQVLRVYKEGVPFDHPEVLVSHTRGGGIEDFYYNLSYRPLWEAGAIVGMIQVAVDVTGQVAARKKLEESEGKYRKLSETLEQEVAERTQALLRSNDDLQQFAHVASHDLKEPVRKIRMFASRLEERFRGEVSAATEAREQVDLNEVLHQIEVDLEVALETSGGKVEIGALPKVEGVPVLLYQMFYNLINNSLKFSRPGVAPHIEVSGQVAGLMAEIRVADNGIGFEQEQAEYIFGTFTRLHSKDQFEGTGLGLALCKKIAERQGGTITAEGQLGQGAVFRITLPLSQEQAVA